MDSAGKTGEPRKTKTKFLISQKVSCCSPKKEFAYCGPEKETCVANQTLNDVNCLVSCDGLYADIEDDSLKQNVVKGRCYCDCHLFTII